MGNLKRMLLLIAGYMVLLLAVTFLTALVKGQEFHLCLSMNLVIPVLCAIVTALFPVAETVKNGD
ncbi:MAG: hypothetical protein J6P48_05270 [Oscillospiraceae bacterium]|nr:hypothetical protein [Oscillospiraceae bacterium]